MSESEILGRVTGHLEGGGSLILFLDYDGTLVPIAPTPEQARPDKALLDLLTKLANRPVIQTIILSGRSLASLQTMLSVPGLTLAGLYGTEIFRAGHITRRGLPLDQCRPTVNWVAEHWQRLIDNRPGFLIEDKGCAVALHGRWAEPLEATTILTQAQALAREALQFSSQFHVLGGHRFLEVSPVAADKAQAVEWFLNNIPGPCPLVVYFGDDDKDEKAFRVVNLKGGVSIGVGERSELNGATTRVASPEIARAWLRTIMASVPQATQAFLGSVGDRSPNQ